jgi:hypothetical protein
MLIHIVRYEFTDVSEESATSILGHKLKACFHLHHIYDPHTRVSQKILKIIFASQIASEGF